MEIRLARPQSRLAGFRARMVWACFVFLVSFMEFSLASRVLCNFLTSVDATFSLIDAYASFVTCKYQLFVVHLPEYDWPSLLLSLHCVFSCTCTLWHSWEHPLPCCLDPPSCRRPFHRQPLSFISAHLQQHGRHGTLLRYFWRFYCTHSCQMY